MAKTEDYDLLSPAFRADPYPTYAAMRREAPVYPVSMPDAPTLWTRGTQWNVTRYADAAAVLRDPRFVKDLRLAFDPEQLAGMPPPPLFVRLAMGSLVNLEDPEHSRLRKLVNEAFSPLRVQGMQPRIEAIVDELLDRVQPQRRMDLVADFAFQVPIRVLTGMLGLPASDAEQLRAWTPISPPRTPAELDRTNRGTEALVEYLEGHFAARRERPREDLMTALIEAEVDGDRLDPSALLSMVVTLMTAGFETTMNLIGNGLLALLRHPAELERLRAEPSSAPAAVEEMLRYDAPLLTSTLRWAAEDVEMHGQRIRRGDQVVAVIGSANRDPDRFPDPDAFDVGRQDNRHLSFGLGPHYCLGAPLARLEAQVAIPALLRRLPGLRLDIESDGLTWRDTLPFHGLEALPLVWS